ncbi:MAG TPA: ferritin-like domain-containing protein [Stellaceae bacterium]|nr:ferritin-like domain-containing protein [Stellaceae bacterium]
MINLTLDMSPIGGAHRQPPETPSAQAEIERDLEFYVIASASFIEITSDLYTQNLVDFFADDEEVGGWLDQVWQPEELRHGAVLRSYVRETWPSFDWEAAYRSFFAEYSLFCSVDALMPTRALQLAALCVVETGTASFYRMMVSATADPALARIAAGISADEVGHYKAFYRHFRRYRALEQPPQSQVLRALLKRAGEVDAADAFYAFKHVRLANSSSGEFDRRDYAAFRNACRKLAKRHFPTEMAMKMFLKPLDLGAMTGRLALPPLTWATRLVLFR